VRERCKFIYRHCTLLVDEKAKGKNWEMQVHGEMGTRNNKITNPAELVGSEVVGW
jgi:hypothetical protein